MAAGRPCLARAWDEIVGPRITPSSSTTDIEVGRYEQAWYYAVAVDTGRLPTVPPTRPKTTAAPHGQSEQQISIVVRGDGRTRITVSPGTGKRMRRNGTADGPSTGGKRLRRLAGIAVGVATVVTAVATVWLLLR